MSRGIGGHARPNRGATDTYITPRAVIDVLGPFDLDPCAAPRQPWPCAARSFTIADDGLAQPWTGRVWLNPPYGDLVGRWVGRLADHGDGVALVFARTETTWFQQGAARADTILFVAGRYIFHREDGSLGRTRKGKIANSGGPSCFLAFGARNITALERSGIAGILVRPRVVAARLAGAA